MIRRATAAGFKVAPTGLAHGTVTLIMDGQTIETTTLREDVETDGRHAKVAFGRDFLADARRRDFTINALSLDAAGRIYDPLGGLDDLAAGRVRFIGDADARIREDYLRILRFFRFSARFGEGALDPDGLSAMRPPSVRPIPAVARAGARRAPEALGRAARASRSFGPWASIGILSELFGFADPARLERAVAIETGAGSAPDGLLRLAALCVIVAEDAERLGERLRLSNAERDRLLQRGVRARRAPRRRRRPVRRRLASPPVRVRPPGRLRRAASRRRPKSPASDGPPASRGPGAF